MSPIKNRCSAVDLSCWYENSEELGCINCLSYLIDELSFNWHWYYSTTSTVTSSTMLEIKVLVQLILRPAIKSTIGVFLMIGILNASFESGR